MPWVKLSDDFMDNPTNRRLGPAARDLFTASLLWCAKGLTDGRIETADLPALLAWAQARRTSAVKLIESGRWIDHGTHLEVAEYLRYQPSRAKVLSDRESARLRQEKARNKGGEAPRHGVTHGVTSVVTNGVSHAPPDPTRPPSTHLPVGSPPLAATVTTLVDGVDFEHHPPPRHDDQHRGQLVANLRALRDGLAPDPGDDAA